VSGNINSSGRRGGDIVIQSTSRGVNVFGTINTSGLSPIIAEIAACKNCGNAGDLNLSAASFLQVTGKVT